jgi:MOSC domain-containing protein YiiM
MRRTNDVHLIDASLFDDLLDEGFHVGPGELGENITTRGIDLLRLPIGANVKLGATARIELRGLRTPCVLIDRFQAGLLKALVLKKSECPRFRAGVMGIVREAGEVRAGDPVSIEMPTVPWLAMPAI